MKTICLFAFAGVFAFACPSVQAVPIFYNFTLSGANESPPNGSLGTGSGIVMFDTQVHQMFIELNFGGLIGNTTSANLHAATEVAGAGIARVATPARLFPRVPAGVPYVGYSMMFSMLDPSSYNPIFIAANGGNPFAAELSLAAAAAAGKAYFNINTTAFPGGEIRGFLTPAPARVPDSGSTLSMLCVIIGGLSGLRRKLGR